MKFEDGMTIRDFIDRMGIDDQPGPCLSLLAITLRSIEQKEASTIEGENAFLLKAIAVYGKPVDTDPLRADFVRWMLDLYAPVIDAELPEWVMTILDQRLDDDTPWHDEALSE